MHRQGRSGLRRWGALACWVLASLFAASSASAVTYEAFVGDNTDSDSGADVKRFEGCIPGGGTIMVGTRSTSKPDRLAEMAMLDSNGALVWRRSYPILASNSTGESVIVVPATSSSMAEGFAITGSAQGSPQRIYVLRVDCNGNPLWTALLPNSRIESRASGYDLALLSSGGVAQAIMVVGEETYPSTTLPTHTHAVGRIARVRVDGMVSWDRVIDRTTNSAGVRLRAVTISPGLTGPNVVAVGATSVGTSWTVDKRAYFYRMTATGVLVCGTYLGAVDDLNDEYQGVTAMLDGRVAVVGTTTRGTDVTSRKVYLSTFLASGCAFGGQRTWTAGSEGISGEDIVETLSTGGQSTGLAITGTLTTTGKTAAHISAVNPVTLAPAAAPVPHRFGADVDVSERLTALDVFGPRLLAGGSRAPDVAASEADLYLVATDPVFTTTCADTMQIVPENPGYPYTLSNDPPVNLQVGGNIVVTPEALPNSAGYCCGPAPG